MRPRGPGAGWSVLITGASSGLGRCLALELARKGCSLVLTARDAARLEAVGLEARDAGAPSVSTVVADLAVDAGVDALIRRLSPLPDALINNAGAGRSGTWASCSPESERALTRLLIDAPLALTRALLPSWRTAGRGAVLNVASTGAFQPGPQTSVYYASKAFLLSWSMAVAREERSWLAVTTLCPGPLRTRFSAAAGKTDVPGAPGPEAAARSAVKAWETGRGLVVPGFWNKALVLASRVLPLAWTAALVEALQLRVRLVIEGSTGGKP